jgi:hypothetical protein
VAPFAQYSPVYEKGTIVTDYDQWTLLDEYPVLPRTCVQFDVVVTALGQAAAVAVAAAFTLRGACFHDGSTASLLGNIDIDIRRTRNDIRADLRLETSAGRWFMRLYVLGANQVSLRWKSIRRPHTDGDW